MRAAGIRRTLTLIVAALGAVLPSPADAADDLINGCDVQISKPGTYHVNTAVRDCPADGITVNASNVVLDLGGRAIDGNSTAHTGVVVAAGKKNVVVQNGTISGFEGGVFAGPGNTVRGVIVRGAQFNFQTQGSTLANDISVDPTQYGFLTSGAKSHISKSISVGSLDAGVKTEGPTVVDRSLIVGNTGRGIEGDDRNTITRNTIVGNGNEGIHDGTLGLVQGNRVRANGLAGIDADEPVLGNVVKGNRGDGIFVLTSDPIAGNITTGNGTNGIRAGNGNRIADNVSSGNIADGIFAPGTERVVGNITDGNHDYGINVGAASTKTGANKAIDNGLGCDPSSLCVPHSAGPATPVVIDCTNGTTLFSPGTYRLQTSAYNCGATIAVHITSPDVTFDLGGRVIDGTGAFAVGVSVDSGLSNVVVENGTVTDWLIGVGIVGQGSVARSLVVRDNNVGVDAAEGAFVSGSTIAGNMTGVTPNDVGTTVTKNVIANNSSNGVLSIANDVHVLGNKILTNGGRGVEVTDGTVIRDNLVLGNGSDGIFAGSSNVVTGNRVIANGGIGIDVDQENTVADNVVRANSDTGISGANKTKILRNVITGNGNSGIDGGTGSVAARNVVLGNLADGITSDGKINFNVANGNNDYGIAAGPNATGHDNVAKLNGNPTECTDPSMC